MQITQQIDHLSSEQSGHSTVTKSVHVKAK